jgi:hypothetical protein
MDPSKASLERRDKILKLVSQIRKEEKDQRLSKKRKMEVQDKKKKVNIELDNVCFLRFVVVDLHSAGGCCPFSLHSHRA